MERTSSMQPMLLSLILFFLSPVSSEYWDVPKLTISIETATPKLELSPHLETHFYTQTLDHFNYRPESYATFQQKYMMNSMYWGGPNTSSPIFVYTGEESSIQNILSVLGFLSDNAPDFKALQVYIEHRYYGESMPFGSDSFQNSSTLGYLSSTQALADYAEIIVDLKKNLSAYNCPVIVFGASYGGMLAAWFRLKYPHIAIGALAASAPILALDDITPQNAYGIVVTNDYKEIKGSCYSTIRDSWSEIDRIAAKQDGLRDLGQIFNTCRPLNTTKELKDDLEYIYKAAAQYDTPPNFPVSKICDAIDGLSQGSDILSRISAGYHAGLKEFKRVEDQGCNIIIDIMPLKKFGWSWQTCTEIVVPNGYHENETMFQAKPFDYINFTKLCQDLYGVTPRPHWITTEFGGHNISSVLKHFASNIIFSNGLRDPYSAGGVLKNISDSVVAVYTSQGSHCLDLYVAKESDPDWLVSQRKREVEIIHGWIQDYNLQ